MEQILEMLVIIAVLIVAMIIGYKALYRIYALATPVPPAPSGLAHAL